ncbi:MAG: hypothetical protein LBG83_00465 [Oscillospiraceae bacterium]|jgi:hypothetical protein|nr:hypothetical protein [Oscillospiraceae bacterium]
MFEQLSDWLRCYIASHRKPFSEYIHRTDLYLPDGSIDEVQVLQTAQEHAQRLCEYFSAEAIAELCNHLKSDNLLAAATWLCLYFCVVIERGVPHFLWLTADEPLFQRYVRSLAQNIAACQQTV